jgi:hypothetical protein
MGEIAGDQQWGLGTIANTRFKGGWGPSEAGANLVRQIGVLQIAEWLRDHAAALPAGRCAE